MKIKTFNLNIGIPVFCLLIALVLISAPGLSQGIAISNSGATPEPSAMLDVQSNEKGVLVPRMTEADRNSIPAPATGLLIYQINNAPGFYYNAGTPASPDWKIVGSNAGVFSQWTNNGQDIYYNEGKVGIGTNTPQGILHIRDMNIGGGNVVFEGSFKSTQTGQPPAQGAGTRMMWYPDKAAFRAGRVLNSNWDADSIGNYSTAFGYATKAKGTYSTVFGSGSSATGTTSMAAGNNAHAMGNFSFAFGANTQARSAYETVLGRHNTVYVHTSGTGWSPQDRLLVVGNGLSVSSRSDAMVILKNGNVGLGISNPAAVLHTDGIGPGEGNVVFEGRYKSDNPGMPPVSGAGVRMMWYPDKAAFRAGGVTGTQWDFDLIGISSAAMGSNTIASGSFSVAWGFGADAEGATSTAWGSQTTSSGSRSTAWGRATEASGSHSTAWGEQTQTSGNHATAWGSGSVASGDQSTAWGTGAVALGQNATAWGVNTIAHSFSETVTGRFNSEYTPNGVNFWSASDRLFVIGNGTSANNRRDALVVLKNGRVGIGTSDPSENLTVQTRIRSENTEGEVRTLINTTGGGAAGIILTYGPSGNANVRISTHSSSYDHGAISVRDANGETKAWMYVDANSVGWVSADRVRIVGGSDLAEQFDILSPDTDPLPGMVVSIDPASTGKLRISNKPYDNKVAGIISGANGVESGMVMGQAGTIADGKYPVSLTGRVYVFACDEGGDIQPGDLLTTSSKPGYAMKASDRHKAFGAAIGKAMTGVNDEGFVLVLVNLQ